MGTLTWKFNIKIYAYAQADKQFVKVEEKKYILIGQIFQGGGPYKV